MKPENVASGPERWSRRTTVGRAVLGGFAVAAVLGTSSAVAGVPHLGGSESQSLTDSDRAAIGDDLRRELTQASDEQQGVVADGQIEVAELWDLAADASECAVEAGAPPIEADWTDKGFTRTQSFGTQISDAKVDRLLAASDICWDDHVGIVEQMMFLDLAPSADEQLDVNRRVAACLAEAGVALDSWPVTDVAIDPALEAECVDAAEG